MKRGAYTLLIANAVVMVVVTIVISLSLGHPLRDPDGFLGPAWVRMPLLIIFAFAIDFVPRTLWRSRMRFREFRTQGRAVIEEHWRLDRIVLVVVSALCFYVTYVCYRNLKNFLPFMRPEHFDYAMHHLDRWLLFGNDPAILLHNLLGTGVSAYFLAWVYLLFLPMVPITVIVWAVWSRNVGFGLWYVTADCLVWGMGTASYYMIPTLGPGFQFPWLYNNLPSTGVTALQDSLSNGREHIIHFDPFAGGVQSVAGFASLHVGITLMTCLMAHYTVRQGWIRKLLWADLFFVVISTTYFGWHYIADDVAGALIAFIAVYGAGWATGHKFDTVARDRVDGPVSEGPVDGVAKGLNATH